MTDKETKCPTKLRYLGTFFSDIIKKIISNYGLFFEWHNQPKEPVSLRKITFVLIHKIHFYSSLIRPCFVNKGITLRTRSRFWTSWNILDPDCNLGTDINPFHATGFFLYPLDTSNHLWFNKFSWLIVETSLGQMMRLQLFLHELYLLSKWSIWNCQWRKHKYYYEINPNQLSQYFLKHLTGNIDWEMECRANPTKWSNTLKQFVGC